jgi:N-acetylneuraminic acid mutarotase
MKHSMLWIAMLALPFIGCQKEKQVKDIPATISENDYTICSDDSWNGQYEFKGHIPSFIFVYNNKAYVPRDHGQGLAGDNRVYVFDGTAWTDKASSIPLLTDLPTTAFTIGDKGYVIIMNGAQHAKQFYEYNITTNVWTRKADFPGDAADHRASFVIGTKGYIVGGDYFGEYTNETWEYNPAINLWRERKSLFLPTSEATGFSIGSKGYLIHGKILNSAGYNYSFSEYDPATNNWTSKTSFPGSARMRSQALVIGNNAYAGGGTYSGDILLDFYKYTPASDSWIRVDNITPANYMGNSFSLNEKGYVLHRTPGEDDMLLRYNPKVCTTILTGNIPNLGN